MELLHNVNNRVSSVFQTHSVMNSSIVHEEGILETVTVALLPATRCMLCKQRRNRTSYKEQERFVLS